MVIHYSEEDQPPDISLADTALFRAEKYIGLYTSIIILSLVWVHTKLAAICSHSLRVEVYDTTSILSWRIGLRWKIPEAEWLDLYDMNIDYHSQYKSKARTGQHCDKTEAVCAVCMSQDNCIYGESPADCMRIKLAWPSTGWLQELR